MRDDRRLKVWRAADANVAVVYELASAAPADERFGLAAQMKQAAVSMPSNIAEGCGRTSDADFERFLTIAAGSASELEYQLDLAQRLWPERVHGADAVRSANAVKRMLWSVIDASRTRRAQPGTRNRDLRSEF